MLGLRMAPRREAASWPFWLSTRAERVWHRSARICAATYWRTRNSRAAARKEPAGLLAKANDGLPAHVGLTLRVGSRSMGPRPICKHPLKTTQSAQPITLYQR